MIFDQTTAILVAHLRHLIENSSGCGLSDQQARQVLGLCEAVHSGIQETIANNPALRLQVEAIFPGYEPFPQEPTRENVSEHCRRIMEKRENFDLVCEVVDFPAKASAEERS